jgi:hypothetical protein
VDANVPGMNAVLARAARHPTLRAAVAWIGMRSLPLARLIGGSSGGLAVEVEGDGEVVRLALTSARDAYLAAVAPAALAIRALAEDRFEGRGVIPPDRQVDADELLAYLESLGIELSVWRRTA